MSFSTVKVVKLKTPENNQTREPLLRQIEARTSSKNACIFVWGLSTKATNLEVLLAHFTANCGPVEGVTILYTPRPNEGNVGIAKLKFAQKRSAAIAILDWDNSEWKGGRLCCEWTDKKSKKAIKRRMNELQNAREKNNFCAKFMKEVPAESSGNENLNGLWLPAEQRIASPQKPKLSNASGCQILPSLALQNGKKQSQLWLHPAKEPIGAVHPAFGANSAENSPMKAQQHGLWLPSRKHKSQDSQSNSENVKKSNPQQNQEAPPKEDEKPRGLWLPKTRKWIASPPLFDKESWESDKPSEASVMAEHLRNNPDIPPRDRIKLVMDFLTKE